MSEVLFVPVSVPDGVKIKQVIGEKDGALYLLEIVEPVRPAKWYGPEKLPVGRAIQ
jgi:hypothetical protein